jgi:dTDP-4-amino-4,6-dideoxygalactose transaminase
MISAIEPGKTVLIAAFSGRALASAAACAGYTPLVADMFADADTRE